MSKAATPQKRFPHGVTLALVFDAVWRLYVTKEGRKDVGRSQLLEALSPLLSEATVDNRLRTLVQDGRIQKLKAKTGRAGKGWVYRPYLPSYVIKPGLPGQVMKGQDEAGNSVTLSWANNQRW